MKFDPKTVTVNVVVPLYDHERYVRESALSVLAQRYDHPDRPPLHIIFSDDCSPDCSLAVVEEIVRGYSGPHRVTLRRNDRNRRNEHLKAVHAEHPADITVLCCDDDLHHPDRVEETVSAFIEREASFVTCNASLIDQDGADLGTFAFDPETEQDTSLAAFLTHKGTAACYGPGMAWCRAVMDYFPPMTNLANAADVSLAFRGTLLGKAIFLPRPLVRRRTHDKPYAEVERLRHASDPAARAALVERFDANTTAIWVVALGDLEHFARLSGLEERLAPAVAVVRDHIVMLTRKWLEDRAAMSRCGLMPD